MLIKKAKYNYKNILVLDFHSMPSRSIDNNIDIVLGNNFVLFLSSFFGLFFYAKMIGFTRSPVVKSVLGGPTRFDNKKTGIFIIAQSCVDC